MRPFLVFVVGVVTSYYGWAALLAHYAASSDITCGAQSSGSVEW
jgi:hypothetical protein